LFKQKVSNHGINKTLALFDKNLFCCKTCFSANLFFCKLAMMHAHSNSLYVSGSAEKVILVRYRTLQGNVWQQLESMWRPIIWLTRGTR
jgi:hypothetical protein